MNILISNTFYTSKFKEMQCLLFLPYVRNYFFISYLHHAVQHFVEAKYNVVIMIPVIGKEKTWKTEIILGKVLKTNPIFQHVVNLKT